MVLGCIALLLFPPIGKFLQKLGLLIQLGLKKIQKRWIAGNFLDKMHEQRREMQKYL